MRILLLIIASLFLSNCGSELMENLGVQEKKVRLEGERVSAFGDFDKKIEVDTSLKTSKIVLPKPEQNTNWSNSDGSQPPFYDHIEADLGKVSKKEYRYISKFDLDNFKQYFEMEEKTKSLPIIIDGVIYIIDGHGQIFALSAENPSQLIWSKELVEKDEKTYLAGIAALSYGNDRIFATKHNDKVVAISKDGEKIIWQKKLGSLVRSTPFYSNGRVFVITADNSLYALDASDGSTLWLHKGMPENIKVLNNVNVANFNEFVILPQSSGEVFAIDIQSGNEIWGFNLVSKYSSMSKGLIDKTLTPMIRDNKLFLSASNGGLFAVDLISGEIIWKMENLSANSLWYSGEYLFAVSGNNMIYAIESKKGSVKWRTEIAKDDKCKSRLVSGLLLAGNKLVTTDNCGYLHQYSPFDGSLINKTKIGKGDLSAPIIAGGKVYITSSNGDIIVVE